MIRYFDDSDPKFNSRNGTRDNNKNAKTQHKEAQQFRVSAPLDVERKRKNG